MILSGMMCRTRRLLLAGSFRFVPIHSRSFQFIPDHAGRSRKCRSKHVASDASSCFRSLITGERKRRALLAWACYIYYACKFIMSIHEMSVSPSTATGRSDSMDVSSAKSVLFIAPTPRTRQHRAANHRSGARRVRVECRPSLGKLRYQLQ